MMLRVLLTFVFCLATAWGQGVPYRNRGIAENKVVAANSVIDGVLVNDIFINDGFFEVQNFGSYTNIVSAGVVVFTPYDMEEMRRYTNNGTYIAMSSRFDTVDEFGYRVPATTFVNTANGRMDFLDGINFGNGLTLEQVLFNSGYVTPLANVSVNASNIENHGLIRIGAGGVGLIGGTNSVTGEFLADKVDLTGGFLVTDDIGNVMGSPSLIDDTLFVDNNGIGNGYLNPPGITDIYWGAGTFTNMNVQSFMIGTAPDQVITPPHRITNSFGSLGQFQLFLSNAKSWGLINQTTPTNINIQTVFVQTGNTNVTADVRWTSFLNGVDDNQSGLLTAVVKLTSASPDPFTAGETISQLYITDQLGAASNRIIIPNDQFVPNFRPLNYFVNRIDPIGFDFGTPSNTVVTPALFFGPGIVSRVATNFYSAYSFNVVSYLYNPPFVPPSVVTNTFVPPTTVYDLPGRFEIRGKSLDLTHAAIRGEGLISLNSPNVVQPVGTLLDAQNLTFNFASTNASVPFRFTGLSKKQVYRLGGDVELWSGVWTNILQTITVSGTNFITNNIQLLYHSLVVDASLLTQTQKVNVAEFNVAADSLAIQDDMSVSNRFNTTAKDLTISGSIELMDVPFTQNSANLPNLRNLTIESTGELRLFGLADFGAFDRNLSNFVNRGTISSYSQSIIADNVDISGTMISGQSGLIQSITPIGILLTNGFATNAGPFYITANRSGLLSGAALTTYGDVNFGGKVFKFTGSTISAGATINFALTDALQDSGTTANNLFISSNGFSMNSTVAIGNLLGSTFEAEPPQRGTFRMLWGTPKSSITSITNIPTSGTWTGLTNLAYSVYSTNTAIGRLKLDSQFGSVFEFSGTKPNSALFVDVLEITGTGIGNLATLTNSIHLLSNAVASIDIYYADIISTNLAKNLPLGFTNLAEFFNGRKFPGGGTFHWVPNFNGPNSSEDVVQTVIGAGTTNQVSISMNRALRHSLIIDMDGDGIANGNDDFPLNNAPGPVQIASIALSAVSGHINVQFTAFPGTYSVQSANSLEGTPVWKTVSTYQHPGPLATIMTVADPDPVSDTKKFYRLLYTP